MPRRTKSKITIQNAPIHAQVTMESSVMAGLIRGALIDNRPIDSISAIVRNSLEDYLTIRTAYRGEKPLENYFEIQELLSLMDGATPREIAAIMNKLNESIQENTQENTYPQSLLNKDHENEDKERDSKPTLLDEEMQIDLMKSFMMNQFGRYPTSEEITNRRLQVRKTNEERIGGVAHFSTKHQKETGNLPNEVNEEGLDADETLEELRQMTRQIDELKGDEE
jgi:hypothetical protein